MLRVFAELLFKIHRLAEDVRDVRHPGAFPAKKLRIAGELQEFLGAFADFVFRPIAEGFRHASNSVGDDAWESRNKASMTSGSRFSLNKGIAN